MDSKKLVGLGLFLGSTIGGYIPVLYGASLLSYSSVFFSALGGIMGVIVGYKLSEIIS
jgi:hypothetical protein